MADLLLQLLVSLDDTSSKPNNGPLTKKAGLSQPVDKKISVVCFF